MILIAFAIGLFVIAAGTRLLIHVKFESPGKLYAYLSWFVVVMGFCFILFVAGLFGWQCCNHRLQGGAAHYRCGLRCQINERFRELDQDVAGMHGEDSSACMMQQHSCHCKCLCGGMSHGAEAKPACDKDAAMHKHAAGD